MFTTPFELFCFSWFLISKLYRMSVFFFFFDLKKEKGSKSLVERVQERISVFFLFPSLMIDA